MNLFGRLFIIAAVVLLTLSLALAGAKFENKDTAKNRQDTAFGTAQGDKTGNATIGANAAGDSTINVKAAPAPEPVDWYDKVIITVNPNVNWPANSSSTSTTTSYNNATDTQTTTTTTQESQ
ncbi:hypothetical protein [Pseudodesulfovibrio sp.]|uniref:hypothetical protein n=1 Tax=Pseudodesulfovibrio sp. TaxID=2035812 RepID=UPI002627590C|nr:hypothetical protein [Pseudodesulfovibrio sp.]MDD3313400.1 hypothetical protein [Pseudodesulfovibrio sp.]